MPNRRKPRTRPKMATGDAVRTWATKARVALRVRDEAICLMYAEHNTYRDIARLAGLSPQGVAKIVRRYNVVLEDDSDPEAPDDAD